MYFVPDNARPEDKAICELINQGLDSRQLFKAAFSFHQLIAGEKIASKEKNKISIQNGLFKGTVINPESLSSQLLPKYIGVYEREVQNYLASIRTPFDCFLNIGCADGFYLACIGCWRHIPCVGVDVDPRSAAAIAYIGQVNGISDLVSFSSSIGEAMQKLNGSILILIDVDGAESKVLEELHAAMAQNPQIKNAHLILETDINAEGNNMNHSWLIRSLCEESWSIDRLIQQDPGQRFLASQSQLSFLDQVALGAEGRPGGQSWIAAKRACNPE